MLRRLPPVGPVLHPGTVASAVIAAICELNPEATIESHGAYLRVLVPGQCKVTRAAIEAHLGAEFRFPADLEAYMPAFAGRLTLRHDEACWTCPDYEAS